MGTLAKIVCKTAGIAGLSAVAYDAWSIGKETSLKVSHHVTADHFEKVIDTTRTLDFESPIKNSIQEKVREFRMDSPIFPVWGKVKGFFEGIFESLADNIIPVTLSSIALAGKGFFSKLGAWSLAGYGVYTVMKEGFGFGKRSPID